MDWSQYSIPAMRLETRFDVARGRSAVGKVPETIELTAVPLPRNANGKVMKRQLREALAAQ